MALFSMRVQVIQRSAGRSVVAAAAYRAGERLQDARQNMVHDYTRKGGVEHTEIILPRNAPGWARNLSRESLWNMVDAKERRKDAQTAREIRVMIPRELSPEARITIVREFVLRNFVSKGMVADVCWHNGKASDGGDQPHAHIMLTMRPLEADGFGNKSRHDMVPDPAGRTHPDGRPVLVESNPDSWNSAIFYEKCREDWENTANRALAQAGSAERIDRRSYLERGLSRLPEPALRLAFHLKELRGVMQQRFGQFQMARYYRGVEARAKAALARAGKGQAPLVDILGMTRRFHDWIDRQLQRLPLERAPPREPPSRSLTPTMER
ncbi:MAG: MobA/MobL family protein [Pseudomonadales bacterium]|jgi:ATP-dependent exoDNAse (exonuclease V) alpha subunit|nr:MobA/MobL family protein [Pseudomonadales bacterium]